MTTSPDSTKLRYLRTWQYSDDTHSQQDDDHHLISAKSNIAVTDVSMVHEQVGVREEDVCFQDDDPTTGFEATLSDYTWVQDLEAETWQRNS